MPRKSDPNRLAELAKKQRMYRYLRETPEQAEERRKRDRERHRQQRAKARLDSTPKESSKDSKTKLYSQKKETTKETQARNATAAERKRKRLQEMKQNEEEWELHRKRNRMFRIFRRFCKETREEVRERLIHDRKEQIKLRFQKMEELRLKQLSAAADFSNPPSPPTQNDEENNESESDSEERLAQSTYMEDYEEEREGSASQSPNADWHWMNQTIKTEVEESEEGGWEESEDQSLNFLDYDANEEDESYQKIRLGESIPEWTLRVTIHERDAPPLEFPNEEDDQWEEEEDTEEYKGSYEVGRPRRKAARNASIENYKLMQWEDEEVTEPVQLEEMSLRRKKPSRASTQPSRSRSRLPDIKLPSIRHETKEERMIRLTEEFERRKVYLAQVITTKVGAKAAEEFTKLASEPLSQTEPTGGIKTTSELPSDPKERRILTPEEKAAKKAAMLAYTRRKHRMEKEEDRILQVLTSLDPLKILEDVKAQEALEYWANFRCCYNVPFDVKDWRRKLYPMLIATPPEKETEDEKFIRYDGIMKTINDFLSHSSGDVIKEFIVRQKNKNAMYYEKLKSRQAKATPEEMEAYKEKLNASYREKYKLQKLEKGLTVKPKGSRRAKKNSNVTTNGKSRSVSSTKNISSKLTLSKDKSMRANMSVVGGAPQASHISTATNSQLINYAGKTWTQSNSLTTRQTDALSSVQNNPMEEDDYHAQQESNVSDNEWMPLSSFDIDAMIQNAAVQAPQMIANPIAFNSTNQFQFQTPSSIPSLQHFQPQQILQPNSFHLSRHSKEQETNFHSSTSNNCLQNVSINSPMTPDFCTSNITNPPATNVTEEVQESSAYSNENLSELTDDAQATEYEVNQDPMCPHCSKFFPNESARDSHVLKVHEAPPLFACCVCWKGFTSTKELIHHIWMSHLESFDGNQVTCCPHCDKTFPNTQQKRLQIHIRKRHKNKLSKNADGASSFYCFLCCSEMSGETDLKIHMEAVHKPTRASLYFCPVCGILMKYNDHLKQHISLFHQKECENLNEYENNEEEIEGRLFSCDICESRFRSEEYLKSHQSLAGHMPIEDPSLKFQCKSCDKKFISDKLRNDHFLRDCFSMSIKCVQCKAPFPTQALLYQHLAQTHTNYSIYNISKSTKSTPKYKHTFFPAGHKGYKCELCPRSYENVSTLLSHFSRQHWDFVEKSILAKSTVAEESEEIPSPPTTAVTPSLSTSAPTPTTTVPSDSVESITSRYVHTCTLCQNSFSGKTFHEIHTNYIKLCKKVCPVCNKQFIKTTSMLKHLRELHKFEEFSLRLIEAILVAEEEQASLPRLSISHHHNENAVMDCTVCFVSLSKEDFHKEHIAVGLTCDPDVKSCALCGLKIIGSYNFLRHMREFHSNHSNNSIVNCQPVRPCEENVSISERIVVYSCVICNTNYKSLYFLKMHMESKHPEDTDSTSKLSQNYDPRGLCQLCNKTFGHVANLLKHTLEVHKPKKELECELCAKVFENEERCKVHKASVHFPAHFNTYCDVCGKQIRAEYIRRHTKFYHPQEAVQMAKWESKKIPVSKILEIIMLIRDGREKPKEIEAPAPVVAEKVAIENEQNVTKKKKHISPEEKPSSSKQTKNLNSSGNNKRKKIQKPRKRRRKSESSSSEEEFSLENEETSSSSEEKMSDSERKSRRKVIKKSVTKKKINLPQQSQTMEDYLAEFGNLMNSVVLLENCDDLLAKKVNSSYSHASGVGGSTPETPENEPEIELDFAIFPNQQEEEREDEIS